MDWEVYIFALFVFALMCMLVFMLVRGLKKNSAEGKLAKMEREERTLALYAKIDEMIDSAEEYIEESKKEINYALESARELCAQMEAKAAEWEKDAMKRALSEHTEENPHTEEPEQERHRPPREEMIEQIMSLYETGMSVEDIARELGYSKGEITFTLKLAAPAAPAKKTRSEKPKSTAAKPKSTAEKPKSTAAKPKSTAAKPKNTDGGTESAPKKKAAAKPAAKKTAVKTEDNG